MIEKIKGKVRTWILGQTSSSINKRSKWVGVGRQNSLTILSKGAGETWTSSQQVQGGWEPSGWESKLGVVTCNSHSNWKYLSLIIDYNTFQTMIIVIDRKRGGELVLGCFVLFFSLIFFYHRDNIISFNSSIAACLVLMKEKRNFGARWNYWKRKICYV